MICLSAVYRVILSVGLSVFLSVINVFIYLTVHLSSSVSQSFHSNNGIPFFIVIALNTENAERDILIIITKLFCFIPPLNTILAG